MQEAQLAYQSAQAAFANRKAELQSAMLSQEAATANIETQYKQAALDLEANETLFKEKLISKLTLEQKRGAGQGPREPARDREAAARDHARRASRRSSRRRKPTSTSARRTWELRRKQLDELNVKAGMSGTLQSVPVERGQQVGPGHQPRARRRIRAT